MALPQRYVQYLASGPHVAMLTGRTLAHRRHAKCISAVPRALKYVLFSQISQLVDRYIKNLPP